MYKYRAKVRRVVDGDTVDFEVDLGFHMYAKIRTRLIDVDTPERGEKDFNRATAMLENLLAYQADKEGWITINTGKTGKYGRWLVTIGGVNEVLAKIWPYQNFVIAILAIKCIIDRKSHTLQGKRNELRY